MKPESMCSMHCCALGSSSDYDPAVFEMCTHRNDIPLDLNSFEQCQFIAPNLVQGDSSKCECCSGSLPLEVGKTTNSQRRKDILKCKLASGCQQWMHASCLKTLTLEGRNTDVYGCRYHTEIFDRHQHPEECHSCNSIFELMDQSSKIVRLLESVFMRY